jgi:hypothetical protein
MVLIGILTAGTCLAADPLPDTVAAYKAKYETLKAKLDTKRDKTVGDAIDLYRKELATLLANVRQEGDLDYVVAIQNELKRTETDRTAPTEPANKRMKHLRSVQWAARQTEDKATEAHDKAAAKLRESYLDSLKALEKRLVAANLIDEAKKAREEIQFAEGPNVKLVSGPSFTRTALAKNGKVYSDMRRLWASIPREWQGYTYARTLLSPKERWVVQALGGDFVYALVPENVKDQFGKWEKVAALKAVYGTDYRFGWYVMRIRATGPVAFPDGLKEAAFPLFRRLVD